MEPELVYFPLKPNLIKTEPRRLFLAEADNKNLKQALPISLMTRTCVEIYSYIKITSF